MSAKLALRANFALIPPITPASQESRDARAGRHRRPRAIERCDRLRLVLQALRHLARVDDVAAVQPERLDLHRVGRGHVDPGVRLAAGRSCQTHRSSALRWDRVEVELLNAETIRQGAIEHGARGAVDGEVIRVAGDPGRAKGDHDLGALASDGGEDVVFELARWYPGEPAIFVIQDVEAGEADHRGGIAEVALA